MLKKYIVYILIVFFCFSFAIAENEGDSFEKFYSLGKEAFENSEYQTALDYFIKCFIIKPDNLELFDLHHLIHFRICYIWSPDAPKYEGINDDPPSIYKIIRFEKKEKNYYISKNQSLLDAELQKKNIEKYKVMVRKIILGHSYLQDLEHVSVSKKEILKAKEIFLSLVDDKDSKIKLNGLIGLYHALGYEYARIKKVCNVHEGHAIALMKIIEKFPNTYYETYSMKRLLHLFQEKDIEKNYYEIGLKVLKKLEDKSYWFDAQDGNNPRLDENKLLVVKELKIKLEKLIQNKELLDSTK